MRYNSAERRKTMLAKYIYHSGFLLEGEKNRLLFDYYRGRLPLPDAKKRLSVFASHHHPDHFDSEIFRFGEKSADTHYYLGCDITLNSANRQKWGVDDAIFARCHRLHKDDVLLHAGVRVQALRSTDMGVAFYIECEDRHIYFAGDHNLWLWREDANFDRSQIDRFYEEIEKLRGKRIDIAFLPLDPRLGEEYWRGFDAFARLLEPKFILPMHMVDDYAIISRMKALPCSKPYRENILEIRSEGDQFEV